MWILSAFAFAALFSDQLSKFLAVLYLKPKGSIPVLSEVFHLSYVENAGIAFGLFRNHAEALNVIIGLCVAGLLVYSFYFKSQSVLKRAAYGFILGGAIGNWIDRVRLNCVIDFLDFRIWPAFNVADSCITIAVIWLIIYLWKK